MYQAKNNGSQDYGNPGPLNHRVRIFCNPALKPISSKSPGNNPITIKEIIYLGNELILISAASCAALASSIALNFVAHCRRYWNNFIQFGQSA